MTQLNHSSNGASGEDAPKKPRRRRLKKPLLPTGNAIDQLKSRVFPDDWKFIPVSGKNPKVKGWNEARYGIEECESAYRNGRGRNFTGIGVLTGNASGGLVALDIDGPKADARLKAFLDKVEPGAYRAPGEEETMAWTSQKPGRRQILWRVPEGLHRQLEKVVKVIFRENGNWGNQTDEEKKQEKARKEERERRIKEGLEEDQEDDYQEVVLRYNKCQSVLPGSTRTEYQDMTRYKWLSYNDGKPAPAPKWLLNVLLSVATPGGWLSEDEKKELEREGADSGILPTIQMRGWFFKPETTAKWLPKLRELIFNHPVFDEYGWIQPGQQAMSGCPFHHSESGTAFQYDVTSGVWYCHACEVGGDVLDFLHRVRVNDAHAPKPIGKDLEGLLMELAPKIGCSFPDDAMPTQRVKQEPPTMSLRDFFAICRSIDKDYPNKEEARMQMWMAADLANYRVFRNGKDVYESYRRFYASEVKKFRGILKTEDLEQIKPIEYIIPDFLRVPSSVMFHARGGLGKTKMALAIARTVGHGTPMRIRGSNFIPRQKGRVLFVGSDMSEQNYIDYFKQQGIDIEGKDRDWFFLTTDWEMEQELEMIDMINEVKPSLVVIDSISSVSVNSAYSEKEQEYARTVYNMSRYNGSVFPPTCFLWIHHNTKDGTMFRGTDLLRNAVDDTWELQAIPEEEIANYPPGSKIMQIGKSRGMRDGARFLVREAVDEWITIEDLTPLVDRRGPGGDPTGPSLVRKVVKEEGPISVRDLKYKVDALVMGTGSEDAKPIQVRTLQRWLAREVASGTMEVAGTATTEKGGKPAPLYRWKGDEAADLVSEEVASTVQSVWGGGSEKGISLIPNAASGEAPESGTGLLSIVVANPPFSAEASSRPIAAEGVSAEGGLRHADVANPGSEEDVANPLEVCDMGQGRFATSTPENGSETGDFGIKGTQNQSGDANTQQGQIDCGETGSGGGRFATNPPGVDVRARAHEGFTPEQQALVDKLQELLGGDEDED